MSVVEFSFHDLAGTQADLDPNLIRDEVRELMSKYLQAMSAANCEPLLSIRSFIAFYGYLLGWEVGIFLLPAIFAINAVIWALRRIFPGRRFPYVPVWSLRWTIAVFRSLHRGEIPLMKLVVNRNLVRLFTLWHIRGRLSHLAAQVDTQYVEAVVERDRCQMRGRDMERRMISASAAAISQKAELKLLLLAIPLIELVAKVAHVGGSKHDLSLSGFFIPQNDLARLEHAHQVAVILVPAAYVLCLLVSCFIRKREILRSLDVYGAERRLRLPLEFPLDIVGWTVVMLIAALPIALQEGEWQVSVILAILYSSPFGYAAIRRLWCSIHPSNAVATA